MIRAKAAGCARANFALRASGTHRRTSRMHSGLRAGEALPHRDGEGASGELYGRSCGARGRLTSGAVRRGRFVAGAGMHPAARGGDIAGACRKSVGRAKEGRGAGAFRCGPHLRTPQSRTGGRKGGAPDEFSDIRRRRERRRCVPAKPTGQAPHGRFVAGAGMHPAARGGDMPGCAESPSDGRKRAAGREHSAADRICGRRNPARAIGKAAPRMNSPTSGEGGREDDASRQSRPDKLRAGGSSPEPECPPPPHGAATLPGRAENPSDGRKRAAGREHSAADRICGRRNPARAVGKAVPRMNSPTSGEGGREDDASRQSRPDKLRTGGSLPEPECTPPHGAATCRGVPKVRRTGERGPQGGSIPPRTASADAAIPHGRSERRRPG